MGQFSVGDLGQFYTGLYTELWEHRRFPHLFLKLAFGGNEVGKVLLPRTTVADLEGVEITKNYRAFQFLDAYKEVFPRFQYSRYSGLEGYCRVALHDGFDDKDRVRIAEEQRRTTNAPLVNFLTGQPYGHRTRQELRAEDRSAIPLAQCDDARFIQQYINNLHSRGFSNVLPQLQAARTVVEGLEAKNPKYTQTLRDYQRRLLNEIEEQPQPFLWPSPAGRTLRLMPKNRGISLLEKSVRRKLTWLWSEWDLSAAQFGIAGKLWGVPRVGDFLADPQATIWTELAAYLGVDRATSKAALKNKGVYPLMYGMPERNVAAGVTKEFARLGYVLRDQPGMSYGKLFLTHPLMEDLLEARSRMQGQIIAQGGAHNCYGDWIAYDPEEQNENSVLAQLAQAVELKLIVPVFQLAKESKGELTVTLYQFDGVSVTTRRSDRRGWWFAEAAAAVKFEADRLGIQTSLVSSS